LQPLARLRARVVGEEIEAQRVRRGSQHATEAGAGESDVAAVGRVLEAAENVLKKLVGEGEQATTTAATPHDGRIVANRAFSYQSDVASSPMDGILGPEYVTG
ncbi:hypothetical protein CLOM_g24328, partial [Closterium sp. NIES-68]